MSGKETAQTAICAKCESYVPRTKIISWTDPENGIGICWECYGQ